jgi:hypothetical protein
MDSGLGSSDNAGRVKILVSAFGPTENPVSAWENPVACASKLAAFVQNNHLDGADIMWDDDDSLKEAKAEAWLIDFTQELRNQLPHHIIVHSPKAIYYSQNYPEGGYMKISESVMELVDFLNVRFFDKVQIFTLPIRRFFRLLLDLLREFPSENSFTEEFHLKS